VTIGVSPSAARIVMGFAGEPFAVIARRQVWV
jgi:hypothetical protein